MKRVLFFFLLTPLTFFAQQIAHLQAFERSVPDNIGKPITLPDTRLGPDYSIDNIAEPPSARRIRLIRNDSLYRKIFSSYLFSKDSLPFVDFTKYDLVLYGACGFCLAVCDLASGHHSCHRPACDYQYRWFLRNKDSLYCKTNDSIQLKIFTDALFGDKPEPNARPVSFPLLRHTHLYQFFELGKKSTYQYEITSDSAFYQIVGWLKSYKSANLPEVDFTKDKLIVRIACHDCLIEGCLSTSKWDNIPHHKGDCIYSASWYIIDKGVRQELIHVTVQ